MRGGGDVYTTNAVANSITKITPEGVNTNYGPTGRDPVGIAIDASGNLYTANGGSGVNTVTKITPAGIVTIFTAIGTDAGAIGIAIDASGNLYVTNSFLNTVSKITPAGILIRTFATTGGLS
jgi:DNA-binding beta-propeller fold protein YncE